VQIADPKLELERSGEERLEGAICFFCKSGLLKPQVTLTKD